MVIRAAKQHLAIAEVDIEYHPRGGESKLSSFRDGWRHLRFLLVHSPTYLFILPGALLAALGALVSIARARADRHPRAQLGHPRADRRRAAHDHRHPGPRASASAPTPTAPTSWARRTPGSTRCARASGSSTASRSAARSRSRGFVTALVIVIQWIDHGFGALGQNKLAIVAFELLIVGLQIFFSSFLLSILGLRRREGS